MKVNTKCFDCFKIVVEEFYDIDMKEGEHFAVHDNGDVRMSSYAYYNRKEK